MLTKRSVLQGSVACLAFVLALAPASAFALAGWEVMDARLEGMVAHEAGMKIVVANVVREKKATVSLIDADQARGLLTAYGEDEPILVSYPAAIGSSQTPSPTGEMTVTRIEKHPNYSYDPDINFQQGNNIEKLTLTSGPNNPVGSVWLALSKPTYGIYGTPAPSKVGKTASHCCVRRTSWDAEELANLVRPGMVVRFLD